MKEEIKRGLFAAKDKVSGFYSKLNESLPYPDKNYYFRIMGKVSKAKSFLSKNARDISSKKTKIKNFEIPLGAVFLIFFVTALFSGDIILSKTGFLTQNTPDVTNPITSLIVSGPTGANINPQPTNPQIQQISQPVNEPPPNFQGLSGKLSSSQMIQDLPDNAAVALRFFTFTSGERVWQNEYALKKANVVLGKSETPDVVMNMHSKYVNRMYNEDFCAILKSAKANGDLGFETQMNEVSLSWKFKSMLKYKDCIA